jgi:uncharacterized alkaline shock family protein YloU
VFLKHKLSPSCPKPTALRLCVSETQGVGAAQPPVDWQRLSSRIVEREHLTEQSELGRITIAADAIAQIVGHTAAECYGVVGMAGKGLKRLLTRDKLTQGIEVSGTGDGLKLDLHVVVEYGLNLAEVAATVRSRVAYEVERLTGLSVAAVEVHIEDVRRSA